MALIKCPECGKEISDKAPACPHCGYPMVQEDFNVENNVPSEDDYDSIIADFLSRNNNNKILTIKALVHSTNLSMTEAKNKVDAYCSFAKSVSPTSIRMPIATKKIGPVQIDETQQKFRINGYIPVNGKKDGIGKSLFKGAMAFGTMGMSVAAEKLIGSGNRQKVGNKEWLDYSDLLNYELLEDDSVVTSGGVGQALVGGALFGGVGAIAGGITAKRTQKKKIESLYIKITVNNFSSPCIMIPLITKSTKTNSKEYETAFNLAHQILASLDVITHNK